MTEQTEVLNEFKALEAGSSFISKNFKMLQGNYPDQFIAIEDSNVVANASDLNEILSKVEEKKKNLSQLIIEFIPSGNVITVY